VAAINTSTKKRNIFNAAFNINAPVSRKRKGGTRPPLAGISYRESRLYLTGRNKKKRKYGWKFSLMLKDYQYGKGGKEGRKRGVRCQEHQAPGLLEKKKGGVRPTYIRRCQRGRRGAFLPEHHF